MIYLSQRSTFSETFVAFQANGSQPVPGMIAATLSQEIYLYIGGPAANERYKLTSEFGLCQKIIFNNQVIGWNILAINQFRSIDFGRIYLRSALFERGAIAWIYLPGVNHKIAFDPLRDRKMETDFYIVIPRNIPYSKMINFPQGTNYVFDPQEEIFAKILMSNDVNFVFSVLRKAGFKISDRLMAEVGERFSSLAPRDRVLGICKIFKESSYLTLGSMSEYHCHFKNWPFPNPEIPDDRDDGIVDPDNHLELVKVSNLISSLAMRSMLTAVSERQAAYINKALIPLGKALPFQSTDPDADIFISVNTGGEPVFVSAALPFERHTMWVCSCNSGFTIGEKITRKKGLFRRESGRIVCELWKDDNHCYYFNPERQKGIALALTD